ncbi:transporter substrate-binding domain-containing protein [Kitasatospora sp. NPDC002965]|uniref:transporter substrate-binding domain-containing protein n=1 Tax=Kitasatospora sp. NPDC002965 TaxID=3154775 RepID=UPI0033AAAE1E
MCPGDDLKGPPGDPAGLDPELARAIGRHLGLRVAFTDLPFDRLIPAVQSGHPDLAMSAGRRHPAAPARGRRGRPPGRRGRRLRRPLRRPLRPPLRARHLDGGRGGQPAGPLRPGELCGRTVAVRHGTGQDEPPCGTSGRRRWAG